MKAQTLTPFELFGNEVRYVVPLFQRPYVWNEEDQWAPLWEDVRTVAERLMELDEARTHGGQQDEEPTHFLGAIVLDQVFVKTGFISSRHVIDGQQRLTTLQLLLDAVEALVSAHGNTADAAALERLVLNTQAVAQSADHVFKVWPTNADQEPFRAAMSDDTIVPSEYRSKQIVKAHDYFGVEAAEWAELDGDPDKARARLHALTRALTQCLRLVVIDLETGDNAQVIFETLNHRGTPLLAADLVKNLIFQEAAAQGATAESIYEESWRRFDGDRWRGEVGRGRNRRPRIDLFLNQWLVMTTLHEVPADRVFTDFKAVLRRAEEPVVDVVRRLSRHADTFDDLQSAPRDTPEGLFNYRVLDVIQAGVWGPWLLWLNSWTDQDLPRAQKLAAMAAVESWNVRRMIVRASSRGAGRLVVDLLRHLDSVGPHRAGDATIEFLAGFERDDRRWPGDAEVELALTENRLYGSLTQPRVRMILEALEDDLRTPKSEEPHCRKGRLTIEHIMPQGWREHWLLPPDREPEIAAIERDRLIHTLGNLTLVNDKLNPALSNRPWTDDQASDRVRQSEGKRSALSEHSLLVLNKRIVHDHGASWTEGDIRRRGAELAGMVTTIWPGPVAEPQSPPEAAPDAAEAARVASFDSPIAAGGAQPMTGTQESSESARRPVASDDLAAATESTGGGSEPGPRTARDAVLAGIRRLEVRTGRTVLDLQEIVDEVRRNSDYEETTIRTYVTSVMCIEAPVHHLNNTDDLHRVDRGRYRRAVHDTPDEAAEPARLQTWEIPYEQWEPTVQRLAETLRRAARERRRLSYTEVVALVPGFEGPHSRALARMLGQINDDEPPFGGRPVLLSAVVTHKDEPNPGGGFYTSAQHNGLDVPEGREERAIFWHVQLEHVFEAYGRRGDR